MTRVELTKLARTELIDLIRSRGIPAGEAFARVEAAIEQLAAHPESGQVVNGDRYLQARMLGAAWGWLCLLYLYDSAADTVTITTFYDARTLGAPGP